MAKNDVAAVAYVIERRTYMQALNERLIKANLVSWIACAIAVVVAGVLAFAVTKRERVYIGISEQGTVIPIVPLSAPSITTEALMRFVVKEISGCFTIDFVNHVAQRQMCAQAFTESGWGAFNTEMMKSGGFVETVLRDRIVTTAVAIEAPVVKGQGTVNGIYQWVVQFPFLITYASSAQKTTQSVLATVTVTRRPLAEHVLGIGISQAITQNQGR